ncbi:MAG: hypothetical protein HY019_06825 [Aquabacterium sp.]|uniref:hypothetical protein n=1 Tax=Aquabacterium sp. TaxID=1872578 RepID=UPI0025C2D139|nr:hypothetical protein [Aquabacterium sp.]MBI3381704.1 hypothetical protein [Aquabacterium sp.]
MQITTLPLGSMGSNSSLGSLGQMDGTQGRPEPLAPGQGVRGLDTATPSGPNATAPLRALPGSTQSGLRALAPQLNQQVGRSQQALSYLGQLQTQLESLKRELSATLSQAAPEAPAAQQLSQLNNKLADFNRLWQQRPQASSGSLDSQLRFQADGQSRQTFKVRGLDAATLQRHEKETLSFTTGADQPDRRIVTAVLEADQPLQARIHKLDQTLGVAGIRVSLDAQGEPTLSVPEANWSSTESGFGVRGGGIRFPASQFHRVKLEPEQAALRPDSWRVGDSNELRQTLQNVVQAQQVVKQSQSSVARALTTISDTLNQNQAPVDGQWAQSFVQDFARLGQQPAYEQWRSIGPAVLGVSRERVDRLLALGNG